MELISVLKKPTVAVTRKLPKQVEIKMSELYNVKLSKDDKPLTKSELIDLVNTVDILVCGVTDVIDSDIIASAGTNLKLIANFGVGVNHIDLETANRKNILVSNTPDVLTEDTADLALTLILMTARRAGEGERIVRKNAWTGWTPTQLMGTRVFEKTLGIIGMGRIGQALAKRAKGFGMKIHYHNRRPYNKEIKDEIGAIYFENLEEMLPTLDFLSINTPFTNETANIINSNRLDLLKSNCILVNTARGGIVDEEALIHSLKTKTIAGAGLDVYDGEPKINPGFFQLENVVLLPHLGSATVETRVEMGFRVIANIEKFLENNSVVDNVI